MSERDRQHFLWADALYLAELGRGTRALAELVEAEGSVPLFAIERLVRVLRKAKLPAHSARAELLANAVIEFDAIKGATGASWNAAFAAIRDKYGFDEGVLDNAVRRCRNDVNRIIRGRSGTARVR